MPAREFTRATDMAASAVSLRAMSRDRDEGAGVWLPGGTSRGTAHRRGLTPQSSSSSLRTVDSAAHLARPGLERQLTERIEGVEGAMDKLDQ